MTVARIKEIQALTSCPESVSIQQALLQVWNECAQEYHKEQLILSGVSGMFSEEQITRSL